MSALFDSKSVKKYRIQFGSDRPSPPSTSDCQAVAVEICDKIEDFRPYIPLIQGLRNPGMRMRHWQQLSDDIQMNVKPKANLTFSRCLEMGLHNHVEEIASAAEGAGKEYAIEQVGSSAQGASVERNLF